MSFDPSWTPGPPPLLPANHDVLSGAFIEQTGILLVPVFNCTEFLPGLFAASAAIGIQLDKAGGPASGSNVITTDTAAPFNCAAGTGTTTTTGPLTLTPLAQSHNEDSAQSLAVLGHADPCTDYEELGDNARLGGLRDPFNPYDFFDVNGNGSIDVPNDILQVILAYNHGPLDSAPSSAYSPAKDRGAAVGPAGWNRLGPDGHIDVPNDILPVELQYQHSCTAPP